MKRYFIFINLFFLLTNCFCQIGIYRNDTSSFYYQKTDFSKIDTISLWYYTLKLTSNGKQQDSTTKSFGEIYFSRSIVKSDSLCNRYKIQLAPYIEYSIFSLSDSIECKKTSKHIRRFTSSYPPNSGGDFFIIGNFIFLNCNMGQPCGLCGVERDYCRPVINYLFNQIKVDNTMSISEIIDKLGIKRLEQKQINYIYLYSKKQKFKRFLNWIF